MMAAGILGDSRFASAFEDEAFKIDEKQLRVPSSQSQHKDPRRPRLSGS